MASIFFFIRTISIADCHHFSTRCVSGMLLTVHMIQHLCLMMLVPPLLLLGSPVLPILRGLPRGFVQEGLSPFLSWPSLRRAGQFLTHPIVCFFVFVTANIFWHLPYFYELALRSRFWHSAEHISFLSAALLFWWPVILPWPANRQWPRWSMIPYLLLGDIQNSALAAFFIFYERVLYHSYQIAPRITGMTPLEDQAAAGSIMWIFGAVAILIPVAILTIQVLSSKRIAVRPSALYLLGSTRRVAMPGGKPSHKPGSSWMLQVWRSRVFRQALRVTMFCFAILIVLDGFLGPQMGAMNLAGVLPWTHWRGLVVIVLLVAGNFFCMACPFMFTRDLGRKIFHLKFRWPRGLRSKWLAVGLLAIYFWAYETFRLWDNPAWIAWIVIGYFVVSLLVDGIFKGASFCKYVCPIGQFNFVQSLVSPLEVKVNQLDVCKRCQTYDCIRGNEQSRGCELLLFQPKKTGNMDCTFCMDCVQACPHQNVSVFAVMPGKELVRDRFRSSIGRFSRRVDIAALALVLIFASFVNAAGMLAPVQQSVLQLQSYLNVTSPAPVWTLSFMMLLLVIPTILIVICTASSSVISKVGVPWKTLVCRFGMALIPLGLSMWAAHFLYHFNSGALSIYPVLQRMSVDSGWIASGNPDWNLNFLVSPESMTVFQLLLLDAGFLFALYIQWRISSSISTRTSQSIRLQIPWAFLATALYACGVWILLHPMEMRGVMVH
jgi:cytochrome c oxidase assembly factor CtaG/polyferredoxin